ncbi:MAG: glycosyltransferase [Candidatus Hadarchaeota archaeon]
MKTAVVYDFLFTKGGMDRSTAIMARGFKADIWTTLYVPDTTYPELRKMKVFDHPLAVRRRGLMQLEAILRFRKMDLSGYDLIITSGDWAKHVGMREKNHPQLHFENTVVRPIYDLYEFIKGRYSTPRRQAFQAWAWFMRRLDQQAVRKIDRFACNSEITKQRIRKFYGRDADVVGVPVNVKRFRHREAEDFFLSVQRIAPPKRVEVQIDAFRELPNERLLIVGAFDDEGYAEFLKKAAPKNVKFIGPVSDEKLVDLYSRCKAAIQTSVDEDFGQVPIEAMASGKPTIAVNEGGFKYTVTPGKTGVLINKPYAKNLVAAIKGFSRHRFDPKFCQKMAENHSEEKWIENLKAAAAKTLEEFKSGGTA